VKRKYLSASKVKENYVECFKEIEKGNTIVLPKEKVTSALSAK
jgi:hypothetical protein